MNIIEQINNESRQLPGDEQAEVLDFIRFLRSKPKRIATTTDQKDEISMLLQHPLQMLIASPLRRDEIYER